MHYGERMISDYDYEYLVKHCDVTRILEIGTGKSTEALRTNDAEVHTVDRIYRPVEEFVHQYVMESEEFWKTHDVSGFDLFFIDGSIGTGDVEEIYNRANDKFKVIFHDYNEGGNHINHDKGVHNYNLVMRHVLDKCHTEFETGGTHCALLQCEKIT